MYSYTYTYPLFFLLGYIFFTFFLYKNDGAAIKEEEIKRWLLRFRRIVIEEE